MSQNCPAVSTSASEGIMHSQLLCCADQGISSTSAHVTPHPIIITTLHHTAHMASLIAVTGPGSATVTLTCT